MNDTPRPRLTEMTALTVLTWVALAAGLVLGIAGLTVGTDPEGDPLIEAALAWWGSLMLIVGAIAGVGLIVLSGVQSLLDRR
ncbi:ABC-type transport system involved in multi-copper enzyme maturation permease subunit [Microbacterium terrae]|uniref:Uncharacterized protein n=1 Tax=Microbacterium terrae TaxID=69369 RepID=A0A0M2HMU6_9MICO|nr:hypothetical protein [Microbacterium terrae]KJL45752.1 hypothetical protein RS81_00082 [Microbacterium terrae]MBP1076714.1 ABC-type transport system involved in multi-copper enzyme maturation permease subunit [Microbacterium terrae]GLJ97542.1 hypothetical protein GCM10017594_07390 [Microbacterium terrae]